MTDGLDLAAIAAALNDLPRIPLRELRCHPDVTARLRASLPETDPPAPDSLDHLFGIPIIEKPELDPGCWELREDNQVVQRCFRGPDGSLYVVTPPPLPPFAF